MLCRWVITFIPRRRQLLISWVQSPSAVILELPKIVFHCFHCSPIYLPWTDGTGCQDLSFLKFYARFFISSFHFFKRIFRSSLLSAIRLVSSAYWRRQWQPTPVLLPGKSDGWRGLAGCSPWGPEESDMTERLHFCFSVSCIGEGHGNPLQCSCLENPRDSGAWWAAIYGVTQSRTRLKWLRSSSSSI